MKKGIEDPPRNCPTCGQDLSEYPYYQPSLSPAAKGLRRIGLLLLPVMGLVYLFLLLSGNRGMGFGMGHGYFAATLICGPSLLLYLLSRLFPRRRKVICLRCSWNEEYPPGEKVKGRV